MLRWTQRGIAAAAAAAAAASAAAAAAAAAVTERDAHFTQTTTRNHSLSELEI
jgi:hypothetical protein